MVVKALPFLDPSRRHFETVWMSMDKQLDRIFSRHHCEIVKNRENRDKDFLLDLVDGKVMEEAIAGDTPSTLNLSLLLLTDGVR